jgi:peptidyl-prolyl cis-trans isomerase D
MLKFFTRLERTRNVVLIIFAVLMVASLVFFYAPTQNTIGANLARSEETVAKVDGDAISVGEVVRQQESMSQMFGGRQQIPAKSMLEQLIGSRIMRQEAARLGLTASDAEVAAEIRKQTPEGRTFDQAVYEQNVISQFGSVSNYETTVRDQISGQKLQAFVTSGVTVSEEEVLSQYQRKNTKFDVSYVSVNSADLSKTINPSDEELRKYFEDNKQAYHIGVPQKKIRYIFVNTGKLGEKLPLSDADLRAEYDALPADKRIVGVNGQEIVLRIAKPELEAEVMAKANELIAELRSKGEVTEEAFANVARGRSENAVSAVTGGKLRGPVREDPNKKDDPYQQLLKMQPGEVSEPIVYQSRVFILRRGAEVPKSFEETKKELEVSLRNRRAYAAAAELAQKIADSLKQTKDVQKTAAEFASQANMSVAEMIKETDYVKPGDNIPNIGNSPQFEEGIAPLEAVGDVGDRTPIQNGFAIPTLADRRERCDIRRSQGPDRGHREAEQGT